MKNYYQRTCIGAMEFIAYHKEFGSDLEVEVFENGRLVERTPMNISDIDTQWQRLIDRHMTQH